MDQPQIEELANRWIEYHLLSEVERIGNHPLFSACVELDELVRKTPEDAWKVILRIQRTEPGDLLLANLAAGPLEDLFVKHGEQFIDRCEELAQNDPMFKKMLGAVWRNAISEEIWDRIKAVAGPSF
jgi:hypothetical protein